MLLLLKGSVDNSEYTAFEESPNELPQCDFRVYFECGKSLGVALLQGWISQTEKQNRNIATAVRHLNIKPYEYYGTD